MQQRLQQFRLAIAFDSGDAHYFTTPDREADLRQPVTAARRSRQA